MTLAELIARAELVSGVTLDPAEWTDFLNSELLGVAEYTSKPKRATISTVKGTSSYPLPTDLLTVLVVTDENNDMYELLEYEDFVNSGVKIVDQELILQPTKTATLTLLYYSMPTLLVDSDDVPSIRLDFHDMLALGAAYNAAIIDEELEKAAVIYQTYNTRKSEFVRAMTKARRYMPTRQWRVVR